jgi:preprotein translocase subunit Sss1
MASSIQQHDIYVNSPSSQDLRKILLIIGLAILVAGLLMAASMPELEKPHIRTYDKLNSFSAGEYVSLELNITGQSEISTQGLSTYLIDASQLSMVNASNIGLYNIHEVLNLTVSGVATHSYVVSAGHYYVGNSSSNINYTVIRDYGLVSFMGTLYVAGLAMILIGIVGTALGAVLRPKNMNQ